MSRAYRFIIVVAFTLQLKTLVLAQSCPHPVYSAIPMPRVADVPTQETAKAAYELGGSSSSYAAANDTFAWGECTWFAYGRAHQLGIPLLRWHADAKDWVSSAASAYQTGMTPRANSLAIWDKTVGGGHGHVAYVQGFDGSNVFFTEANVHTYTMGGGYDGCVEELPLRQFESRLSGFSAYIYLPEPASSAAIGNILQNGGNPQQAAVSTPTQGSSEVSLLQPSANGLTTPSSSLPAPSPSSPILRNSSITLLPDGSQSIEIFGSGFVSGSKAVLQSGGNASFSVIFLSSAHIQVIARLSQTTPFAIAIHNPDGGTSGAINLVPPSPLPSSAKTGKKGSAPVYPSGATAAFGTVTPSSSSAPVPAPPNSPPNWTKTPTTAVQPATARPQPQPTTPYTTSVPIAPKINWGGVTATHPAITTNSNAAAPGKIASPVSIGNSPARAASITQPIVPVHSTAISQRPVPSSKVVPVPLATKNTTPTSVGVPIPPNSRSISNSVPSKQTTQAKPISPVLQPPSSASTPPHPTQQPTTPKSVTQQPVPTKPTAQPSQSQKPSTATNKKATTK